MSKTTAALDAVPRKTLKSELRSGEATLNPIESPGMVVQKALFRAGISQKAAALTMELGEGQFTRQLQGLEHLSWQRLCRLPDVFWLELMILICETRGVARVRTQIDFERRAG